jgi:hypothetical protein
LGLWREEQVSGRVGENWSAIAHHAPLSLTKKNISLPLMVQASFIARTVVQISCFIGSVKVVGIKAFWGW